MQLNEYQKHAKKTALYPNSGKNLIYPVLGLASEAGEVAGKVKKVLRDHGGRWTPEKKKDLKSEIGDVLWYVAIVASELGFSLEEVARENVAKLADRKKRKALGGSGDKR